MRSLGKLHILLQPGIHPRCQFKIGPRDPARLVSRQVDLHCAVDDVPFPDGGSDIRLGKPPRHETEGFDDVAEDEALVQFAVAYPPAGTVADIQRRLSLGDTVTRQRMLAQIASSQVSAFAPPHAPGERDCGRKKRPC